MTRMLRTLALAFSGFALVATVGCASTQSKESAGEYVDDATVTASVKAALVADPQVKARDVNVETFRGTVQLSGFVDDQRQIDRAVEIARNSKGVKSVKNDIRIKTPPANESAR
ncbi:MAG TPA: BON domain-containing protein [Burkholderiaceae bacterium]|nr:BON domain-containing protein [Burkholderiaceae bacterium]